MAASASGIIRVCSSSSPSSSSSSEGGGRRDPGTTSLRTACKANPRFISGFGLSSYWDATRQFDISTIWLPSLSSGGGAAALRLVIPDDIDTAIAPPPFAANPPDFGAAPRSASSHPTCTRKNAGRCSLMGGGSTRTLDLMVGPSETTSVACCSRLQVDWGHPLLLRMPRRSHPVRLGRRPFYFAGFMPSSSSVSGPNGRWKHQARTRLDPTPEGELTKLGARLLLLLAAVKVERDSC